MADGFQLSRVATLRTDENGNAENIRPNTIGKVEKEDRVMACGQGLWNEDRQAEDGFQVCFVKGRMVQITDITKGHQTEPVWLKNNAKCLAWNQQGNFCVVGDDNGTLHFMTRNGWILFSQKVLDSSKGQCFECLQFLDMPSFFDHEQVGDDLFVVSRNPCKIIRVSNLCLNVLEDAAESENKALLQSIRESVCISFFDISNLHTGVCGLVVHRNPLSGFLQAIVADSCSTRMSVYTTLQGSNDHETKEDFVLQCSTTDPLEEGGNLVQIVPLTEDRETLLVLSKSGRVSVWDARQLFHLGEIRLPKEATGCGSKCTSIFSFGHSWRVGFFLDSGKVVVGKLRLLHELDVEFCPDVVFPIESRFVDCLPSQSCSPKLILFGIDPKATGSIVALEIRESNPVVRLESLIRNHKFDEALELAGRESIPDGIGKVLRSKLIWLFEQSKLSLLEREGGKDALLEEATSICKKLAILNPESELPFIVKGCLSVVIPGQFQSQMKLMTIALQLCEEYAPGSPIHEQVRESLFRAETYMSLFEDSLLNFSGEAWQKFRTCDMAKEVSSALTQGHFHAASIILERHGSKLEVQHDVGVFLSCIPFEIPVCHYSKWIRERATSLLSLGCFQSHDRLEMNRVGVSSWAQHRANQVEQTLGPRQAIDLVRNVLCVVRPDRTRRVGSVKLHTPGQRRLWMSNGEKSLSGPAEDAVSRLVQLEQDLAEIIYLKTDHGLDLKLEEFTRLGREEIVMLLLDRIIAPELVKQQIIRNVTPCSNRYGLHVDKVLADYVDKIAPEIDGAGSAREQCAANVALNIQDPYYASQAILSMMRNISPPYSEELESLVLRAVSWNTDVQEELLEQKRLMDLGTLVARFRVHRRLNFSDQVQARTLLLYVLASDKRPGQLEDALEIARAYHYIDLVDVLCTAMENIILDEELVPNGQDIADKVCSKVSQFRKLAAEAGTSTEATFRSRSLTFCELTLEDLSTSHGEATRAACTATFLQGDEPKFQVILDLLLQVGERIKLTDLIGDEAWYQTYKRLVLERCDSLEAEQILLRSSILLKARSEQADPIEFTSLHVALTLAREKQYDACLEWCSKIREAGSLHKVAIEISVRFGDILEKHDVVETLLTRSAISASYSLLPRVVELLRSTEVVTQIVKRCDLGAANAELWALDNLEADGDGLVESGTVPRMKCLGVVGLVGDASIPTYQDNWFQESESVLTGQSIIPLVTKLVFLVEAAREGRKLQPLGRLRAQIVDYLCSNGATQLALHVLAGCSVNPWVEEKALDRSGLTTSDALEQIVEQLARKSVSAKFVDSELCLGYLASITRESDAYQMFRSSLPGVKQDFGRLERLAGLGIDLGRLRHMNDLQSVCIGMAQNASWWIWLSELGVGFDYRRLTNPSEERTNYVLEEVVGQCISLSRFDLPRMLSFFDAYQIDRETGLESYLKTFLTKFSACRSSSVTCTYLSPEKILENCLKIDCKLSVKVLLKNFETIDGKDYELLRAVAHVLSAKSESSGRRHAESVLHVLELLQACEGVTRKTRPVETVSTSRINLHKLWSENPWEEIAVILTPETIKWLVALGDPLQLEPDDFYLCLIRKLACSGAAVKRVLRIVAQVSNHTRALEACDWLVGKTSDSISAQIAVLSYAVSRAQAENIVADSALKLLHELETRMDLSQIEMDQEEGRVVLFDPSDPAKLIFDLYESFGDVASTAWEDTTKLHKIAVRITARYGLDIQKLCRSLVLRWLSLPGLVSGVEDTERSQEREVVFKPTCEENRQQREERLLQKISYVLRFGSSSDASMKRIVTYLLSYVFQKASPPTFLSSSRALAAVFHVSSHHLIEEVCAQNPIPILNDLQCDLRQYWQYCLYMVEFEELRLPRTIDQLIKCDKVGLINALWRDYRQRPRVVQLVANLITDFEIFHDLNILQAVVTQMEKLGMRRSLLVFLESALSSTITSQGLSSSRSLHDLFRSTSQAVFRDAGELADRAEKEPVFEVVRSILMKLHDLDIGFYKEILKGFHECMSLEFALESALLSPRVKIRKELISELLNECGEENRRTIIAHLRLANEETILEAISK